mmetsp:Transcript_105522/g.315183  ORF Transcript_105522/g.315183 Transcript_105522/m.315183 type:complete len:382 (+) Transcript_105522:78-1223(+)
MSIFAAYSAGKTVGASSTGGTSFGANASIFISSTIGKSSTGGYAGPTGMQIPVIGDGRGGGIFGSGDAVESTPSWGKRSAAVPPIVDNRRTNLATEIAQANGEAPAIILTQVTEPDPSPFSRGPEGYAQGSVSKSSSPTNAGGRRMAGGQVGGSLAASESRPRRNSLEAASPMAAESTPAFRSSQPAQAVSSTVVDRNPARRQASSSPKGGAGHTNRFGMSREASPEPPPLPPPPPSQSAKAFSKVVVPNAPVAVKKSVPEIPLVEMTGNQTEDMKRLLAQLNGLQVTSPSGGHVQKIMPHDDEVPATAFDELRDTTMKLMAVMPQKEQLEKLQHAKDGDNRKNNDGFGAMGEVNRAAEEALKERMRDLANAGVNRLSPRP